MDEIMKSFEEVTKAEEEVIIEAAQTENADNLDNLLAELNEVAPAKTEPEEEDINAAFFHDIVDTDTEAKYTEEDLRFEEFNELREARNKGRILEGRIASVEYTADKSSVYATISRGRLDIHIPATELIEPSSFNSNFFTASKSEQLERYYQVIRKRIGSKVSFLLNDCRIDRYSSATESHIYTITGSVLKANAVKRDYYFFGSEQKVKTGSLVQAKVLSYNDKVAIVSCCGCEIPMTVQDIQWREYIDDLRHVEDFGVGKTIQVSVYKLSLDKNTKTVKEFRVSRRYIGHDELKKSLEKVRVGRSYLGQVISVEPRTKRALAYINDKTVRCYIPTNSMVVRQLYPGDDIVVTVTKVDKEHGFVLGSAVEISIAE